MSVDVNRILKDLGELPKFRFPEHIERSGHVARDGWGVDCGEVYSPPRVIKLVGEVGLQAGCALDFTTLDEEGNSWDFNVPSHRAKAMKLLDVEKPLMLITCPMCGPFGNLN